MLYRLFLILTLFCFGTSYSLSQRTNDKAKIQRQKQETTNRIKQNTKQFEQNKAETARRLRELSLIEAEISDLDKEIKAREKSVDSIDNMIVKINDTIADLTARLDNLSEKYASALRHQQGNYRAPSTLSYLFASKTVSQAMRRYRALKQFAKWRSRKASEIESLKDKLQERKTQLSVLEEKHAALLDQNNKRKETLVETKKRNETLVASLQKKGSEIKSLIADNQKELQQLEKQLEKIIAEEQARIAEERRKEEEARKAAEAEAARLAEQERIAEEKRLAEEKRKEQEKSKNNKNKKKEKEKKKKDEKKKEEPKPVQKPSTISSASTAISTNGLTSRNGTQLNEGFKRAKGNLPYPVDGKHIIVRGFGRQKHPDLPMIETDNPGIDISVSQGEQARAVYEGIVSAIFQQPGYNNVVMVRHGDYITIYANLENINVKKGDRIPPGQALGKIAIDDDDVNQRSILHFEIRHEKDKENPTLWLR